MIHKCVVSGCPNQSDFIIHYSLPEDVKRRQQWVQFITKGGNDENVSLESRVCGGHFPNESFTKLDLGFTKRLILQVDAVPSVYPEDMIEAFIQNPDYEDQAPHAVNGERGSEGDPATNSPPITRIKEEPQDYEMSCDAMRPIKEEPQDYDAYGEDTLDRSGVTVKAEFSEDQADDKTSLRCAQCGKCFGHRDDLRRHELSHKSLVTLSSRSYPCKLCDKVFAHRGFLKAHQKIHSESTKILFPCTKCDRKFRNKNCLKKHMSNHLARLRYPCPLCKEDFELKGSLHAHMNTHQGERFCCTFCKRGFLRVEAYMRHIEAHSVVTDYYCEKCDIYQITQRGFESHQKKHELDPTYGCGSGPNGTDKEAEESDEEFSDSKVDEEMVIED